MTEIETITDVKEIAVLDIEIEEVALREEAICLCSTSFSLAIRQ